MSKLAHLLLRTLAVAILSGCANVLLDENFEGYEQPDSCDVEAGCVIPIEGDPTCDVVWVFGDDPAQFTVSPTNAIQGNLSFEFEPAFSAGVSRVAFIPCHTPDTDNSIIFQWRGRFEGGASSVGLQARIEDTLDPLDQTPPVFGSTLFFNIRRESIEIGSGGTVMNTIAGDFRLPHTLIARLVPATNEFHVGVFSESLAGGNETVNGDLNVPWNVSQPGLMLHMLWEPDTSPPDTYRVDEVRVTRRR